MSKKLTEQQLNNIIKTTSSCKLDSNFEQHGKKLHLICYCGNKFTSSIKHFKKFQKQCKICASKLTPIKNICKRNLFSLILPSHKIIEILSKIEIAETISEKLYCYINNIIEIPKCLTCNNKVNYRNFKKGYNKFCSYSCIHNNDKIKKENTNKIKQKWTDKTKEEINEIVKKIKQTKTEKYGNENYNNNSKRKETCLEKYDEEHYSKTNDFKEKYIDTCQEKYGVDNISQLEKIKDKKKETSLNNYGTEYYTQTDEYKNRVTLTKRNVYWDTFLNNLKKKDITPLFNKIEYLDITIIKRQYECSKCQSIFETDKMNTQYIFCPNHKYRSSYEFELEEFIRSLGIENIELNKRVYYNGNKFHEIDIFLPDYNLGIEFHGLYWHSDFKKDKKYHQEKYIFFKEMEVSLIQIFENEWIQKRNIVEGIIKSKVRKNKSIYARKCLIKEIDNKEYKQFLDLNHIQGHIASKIMLGLYYHSELVFVLSVGYNRFKKGVELHRLCSKMGYNVVGGFSRLFKYCINKYNIQEMITYSNLRYFEGKVYKNVGFYFDHITSPNYYYFKSNDMILHNRMKFQKHKLKKLLKEYDENKTEYENMITNNYLRIYDAGNNCYIWNK